MQNNHANDNNEIIKNYLKEISQDKFKPIPYAIEKALLKSAKGGNKKAEKQLIEAHVRMVFNIAKRYKGLGVEFTDLIQEGNLGLYEALNRFDNKKEVRFCVYAEWWIKNYIMKCVTEKTNLTANEISINSLSKDNDDKTKERESDELEYKSLKNEPISYDEEENKNEHYSNIVDTLLSSLDERMKFVIESCYGLNGRKQLTMVEISKKMGLTPERVRQIKVRAMMTLRSNALMKSISFNNFEE